MHRISHHVYNVVVLTLAMIRLTPTLLVVSSNEPSSSMFQSSPVIAGPFSTLVSTATTITTTTTISTVTDTITATTTTTTISAVTDTTTTTTTTSVIQPLTTSTLQAMSSATLQLLPTGRASQQNCKFTL